jgi:hypothetical protein
MSGHTRGPWQSFGVHVEDCHHHRCVADCQPQHETRLESVECLRNACLIAAAPDLLKALRSVLNMLDHGKDGKPCGCAVCQGALIDARAALARAEGRA